MSENIVSISKSEQTYQDISDILTWYEENSTKESIEAILHAKDRLAVLSFRLAEIASVSKREYNGAYFIRKINVARKTQELQKQGMAYNKADTESMLKNELFYRNEILSEARTYKDDLVLRQVNKVLDSMQQRIAFMRSELNKVNAT